MARLKQWCEDPTNAEKEEGATQRYDFVLGDQSGFETHQPKAFESLATCFMEYRSQGVTKEKSDRFDGV